MPLTAEKRKIVAEKLLGLLSYNREPLASPLGQYRRLDIGYVLEYADPQHRAATNELKTLFEEWKSDKEDISFWDWLEKHAKGQDLNRVDYLDDKERAAREVISVGGQLRWAQSNEEVHTEKNETTKNGQGWAAFVISPDDKLYVASHLPEKFHHSSFLSGAPVKGAGELVICKGQMRVFTPKSGHYKPPLSHTWAMACWFRDHRMGGGVTLVMPDNDNVIFCHLHQFIKNPWAYDEDAQAPKLKTKTLSSTKEPPLPYSVVVNYIPEWARYSNIGFCLSLLQKNYP